MATPKEFFEQFWDHYTKAFYNYNFAQFAHLSSQFKVPMPMPTKIKEVGDRHLRMYFDEIWGDCDLTNQQNPVRLNELHQQPRSSNARQDNAPNNDLNQHSHNARPYSNDRGQLNIQQRKPYNNDRKYQPNIQHRKSHSYDRGYHPNILQHKPNRSNNPIPQHPRAQNQNRGGYQNTNKTGWYSQTARKRTYTSLSDDESSERAASGNSQGNNRDSNNFNQKMTQSLGFIDDDDDDDDRQPLCRMM